MSPRRHNPECRFCVRPEPWRVVHETADFVVQAGLGPLWEGYALVLSREHVSCCAALDPALLPQFDAVVARVQGVQRELWGGSTFFEHGRSGSCVPEGHGEDLCFHAHLHVAPVDVDLAALVARDHPTTTHDGWPAVHAAYEESGEPYVLAQRSPGGTAIDVAHAPRELPKRYLRTVLATQLGEPHLADWVAFPGYDVVEAGVRRLRAALA